MPSPTKLSFMDSVLVRLQEQMRPEQFDTWFRGLALGELSTEEVEFLVPTGFVRDWLNRYYLGKIQAAANDVFAENGESPLRIRICADPSLVMAQGGHTSAAAVGATSLDATSGADLTVGAAPANNGDAIAGGGIDGGGIDSGEIRTDPRDGATVRDVVPEVIRGIQSAASTTITGGASVSDRSVGGHHASGPSAAASGERLLAETPLNKDYTFEQFVVGPSNQLSHAASLAVGQNPGRSYNPLFIHGNVGLGKTHLLQSICQTIQKRKQPSRVVYLSCEEFTNRFIVAIQSGRIDRFRDHYRAADVLVIDDVQFLAGKEKTQEEFFHTFNALYNSQKQIVISSDRSPMDIPTVQDRLVSRFKWGLVTDIQPPCFETRLVIVKRKALMRSIDLDDDVANFIADRIVTNIREIEGAVIKVIGVAAITERPINLALAEEALQGVATPAPNQITIPDVIGLITSEFSISARDLTGKSRTQKISLPRQIGMFLAREYTDHSLEEVGRYFGNRDHTTVLYAVTKIKKRAKSNPMFRELLSKLSNRLESGSFQRSK